MKLQSNNSFIHVYTQKFCVSATYITHFTYKNVTDIGNVTKQAFIFEYDHRNKLNFLAGNGSSFKSSHTSGQNVSNVKV